MAESITPAQIRGARGMLNWSMLDLARAAGVSVSTVKRAEEAEARLVSLAILGQMQRAFEEVGMLFLPDEGDGLGMRRRPRTASPVARFF